MNTYHKDKYGRYTKKTNVRFVIAGLATIAILGAYLNHVNAAGSRGNIQTAISSESTQNADANGNSEDSTNCIEVSPRYYKCGKAEAISKWSAYIESQLEKSNSHTFKATVTGYSSRTQETDDSPEIAANGQNILRLYEKHDNTCATNDYAFGTKLVIPGLGSCTVRDRMNRRYTGTGHIDFYFGMDYKAALQHGSKVMEVIIMN